MPPSGIMHLMMLAAISWHDWTVIVAFLAVTMAVGLLFTRRASKSVDEYFVGGRSLPWWLAGTSMVATTFAADTPLAITELVRIYGIYHNWYWWCFGFGAVLSTVLLARMWRRSGVRTDVQLIELRYSGRAASVLRGFRAGYFGIVWNLVTMAWVTKAMVSIGTESLFGSGTGQAVQLATGQQAAVIAVLLAAAGIYTIFSGLWGVVVTDLLQFALAMVGAVALAIFAVSYVGGMDALLAKLHSSPLYKPQTLAIIPSAATLWDGLNGAFGVFLVYVGVQWWTDKTVDQGGYLAQRLLACRSENHSLAASLWFAIAHYALRPWPWIIAALATMVLFPTVTGDGHKATYTMLIMTVMGPWWRGLLVASLLAAFISTINTQINWGASYLLNDLYQPFVAPGRSQRHYMWVSRALSLLLLIIAGFASYFVGSISEAWKFLTLLGAGSGLVLLGRWLWWRVSAVSELVALGTALLCSIVVTTMEQMLSAEFAAYAHKPMPFSFPFAPKLLIVLGVVTVAWLALTFLTRPTSMDKLVEFVLRIRPPGPGWRPVHARAGTAPHRWQLARVGVAWLGGVMLVFGLLAGIGQFLLVGWPQGLAWVGASAAGCLVFVLAVPRGEIAGR